MSEWCKEGMRVEVILTEDGLAGSRYVAKVISMNAKGHKGSALVEFEVCMPLLLPLQALLVRELNAKGVPCACV